MSLDTSPLLFRAFPRLKDRVPWVRLGETPTPVEPLEGLGAADLWIKRDDLTSAIYGGNKVRKLEFVLADVQRQGRRHVVTMGGTGTNHGLATAIHAARLGLTCEVVLSAQPVTPHVQQNLRLLAHSGARLHYSGGSMRAGLRFFGSLRLTRPRAYFLYAGGSSPLGTLGYVDAAFELQRQVEAGEIPEPSHIFCPLGSTGTVAGLTLGLRLCGLRSEVVGVRVFPSRVGPVAVTTPRAVARLMGRSLALLRGADSSVPLVKLRPPTILGNYLGAGYGHATGKGEAALALFWDQVGVALETTYTAKAAAALLDFAVEPGRPRGPVLYWHTFSSVDLSAQAASVDVSSLPAALRRLL